MNGEDEIGLKRRGASARVAYIQGYVAGIRFVAGTTASSLPGFTAELLSQARGIELSYLADEPKAEEEAATLRK